MRKIVWVSILLMLVLCTCARRTPRGDFVARVRNEYLTQEKVRESLDTTALSAGPQVRDFVTRWVNSALLYEEAKAHGFDRNATVIQTLEEMKRQLAINELVQSEVYTDELRQVTPEEAKAYYNDHQSEYVLTEDVAKIQYVLLSSREAAASFRNQIVKGKGWSESLGSLVRDTVLAAALIGREDSLYVKESTVGSKELWKTASQLSIGEISAIIKAGEGFYVVRSFGIQRKGEIAEMALVEPEIRDRVLVEKHQRALEQYVERLRKKYTVHVNLGALGYNDTLKATR